MCVCEIFEAKQIGKSCEAIENKRAGKNNNNSLNLN